MNERFLQVNRARWDELVGIHAASEHYDVEGFRAGGSTLRGYEVEDVGDVGGKTLLHLQCHFGLDTLSWARLGARVTGVDFSEKAIELARSIAGESGIEATFVCSDVDSLPAQLTGEFDVVYTSRGVVNWLPDIDSWARVVGHFLSDGGIFYITEGHPVLQMFDHVPELRLRFPYFHRDVPDALVVPGTYAAPGAEVKNQLELGWSHGLGEIVTALARAGLCVEFLREDAEGEWDRPFLEASGEGRWRYPPSKGEMPLWFSLKAAKR